MKVVEPADELMIISEDGVVIRTSVEDISQLGRSTQGVHVMNVAEGDKVCAVATATEGSKRKEGDSVDDESIEAGADSDVTDDGLEQEAPAVDFDDDIDDEEGDE